MHAQTTATKITGFTSVRWLVFIAEEFDGVGGRGSGDTATVYMQTLLDTCP